MGVDKKCPLRGVTIMAEFCRRPKVSLKVRGWWQSSSVSLYVHSDHKDYLKWGTQEGHLNFHTAPELWVPVAWKHTHTYIIIIMHTSASRTVKLATPNARRKMGMHVINIRSVTKIWCFLLTIVRPFWEKLHLSGCCNLKLGQGQWNKVNQWNEEGKTTKAIIKPRCWRGVHEKIK